MRHSSVELVAAAENDLGYVWQYMTAYLPLVESDIPEIRRFGTYALAYLSKSGKWNIIGSNWISKFNFCGFDQLMLSYN